METMLAGEKNIEALVEKTVQKHVALTFENFEEVRKSPAGTLVRIEERLNSLERRMERDMVTRAEFANFRGELKVEIANTRAELIKEIAEKSVEQRRENANIGSELRGEIANSNAELRKEIANSNAELRKEIANTRTDVKSEFVKVNEEISKVKDSIWKLRLLIIGVGILVVLTNPKVIELIGKLINLM